MAGKRVAILGATGVVGTQMRQCLEERNFPVSELVPLASAKSAGKTLKFKVTLLGCYRHRLVERSRAGREG